MSQEGKDKVRKGKGPSIRSDKKVVGIEKFLRHKRSSPRFESDEPWPRTKK